MSHIKTLHKGNLKKTILKSGCGECQASCQSACKTSCTVANQNCEQKQQIRINKVLIYIFNSSGVATAISMYAQLSTIQIYYIQILGNLKTID